MHLIGRLVEPVPLYRELNVSNRVHDLCPLATVLGGTSKHLKVPGIVLVWQTVWHGNHYWTGQGNSGRTEHNHWTELYFLCRL